MKHLKDYNINEIIEYYEHHNVEETVKHFNTSKAVLYRTLKKYNYRKPRELIIKLRKETISKDSLYWQKRNEKTVQTNLEKYGETSFTKTNEYKEKTKKTNLKKYGSEWFLSSEQGIKIKKDFANSLLVDNIFQAEEIKEKIRQTNLEKYGVENPSQAEEIKKKKEFTSLQHYGVINPNKSEEIRCKTKQTNQIKYGVENVFASEEIKEKIRQTNLEKYGVKYASSNEEIRKKMSTSWINNSLNNKHHFRCYKYNNIYFDSFPELAFYLKKLNDGINILRCEDKFKYTFNGVTHTYLPDFKIDNEIIELKSPYLYKFMLIENTVENAKLNCIIKNNVILKLTNSKEILDCIKWFKLKYNKEDFKVMMKKEK